MSAVLICYYNLGRRQGSSVSMVTRLWAGWPGFISQHGQLRDFFFFTTMSRLALGPT